MFQTGQADLNHFYWTSHNIYIVSGISENLKKPQTKTSSHNKIIRREKLSILALISPSKKSVKLGLCLCTL